MRKWLILVVLLVFGVVKSQSADNQWIDYGQNYYKFPIHKDGIYRLTYLDLINAGIGISSIDARNLQVFGKGEELYLFVSDGGDNVIGSGSGGAQDDYIEFYAEKNDGWYDYAVFSDSLDQGNPQYSMYTDTLYYYLSWNNSTNNRRIGLETDVDFASYPESPYFWSELDLVQNSTFSTGEVTVFGSATPGMSSGVGWASANFSYEGSHVVDVNTPNAYTSGPASTVSSRVVGKYQNAHNVELKIEGQVLVQTTFFNYEVAHFKTDFSSALLGSTTEVSHSSTNITGNEKEKLAVSYLKFRYPRTYSLDNASEFKMIIPSGAGLKDYVKVTDFDNGNKNAWIYDLTNHKKISMQIGAGSFEALVPNSGVERTCVITSEAAVNSISSAVIKPVSGNSSFFIDYRTLAMAKGGVDYLIVSGNSLMGPAEDYAAYRSSTGFVAMAIDAEQLYDQYSYGIRKHPSAIRSFALEAHLNWGTSIKNLLLLGKSVGMQSARNPSYEATNELPTWGVLGADVGFTNGTNGSILEPLIPTGRVAANVPGTATNYLNKVIEYESATVAPWMKNILHFGGGSNTSEQSTFKNYLSSYETIIEAPDFGGNVHTFLKSSSDPLQINLSDSVTNLINSGVTMMCFFGHAYGTNFDQSIDEPQNYSNTGRYSFVLANACLIGNIHTASTGSGSERFVLAESKGSIGFLGSSTLGVPPYLNLYSEKFYEHLSKDSYGKSVGELIKETIIDIQDTLNVLNRDLCMHMTLHGDPAIILNAHTLPDYSLYPDKEINGPQIYFTPTEVTNEVDSFTINIIVSNFGKAIEEVLDIQIKRSFPTNGDTIYSTTIANIYYKDTVSVTMPVSILEGTGLNSFEVSLDPLGVIPELSELNNVATVPLIITSSAISPVYPYEFAVIPDQFPLLKASTGDPYVAVLTYTFQIDTNANFSSPNLYEENIVSGGGVVHWDPVTSTGLKSFFSTFPSGATIQNPNVYFWRVTPVVASGEKTWRGSSFQYIAGKSGWGQSHFHQFSKNDFTFMEYKFDEFNYDFIEQIKELHCINSYNAGSSNRYPLVKLDGTTKCQFSTVPYEWPNINVIVVDKVTLDLWRYDEHGDYGHLQMIPYVKKIAEWNEENFQFFSGSGPAMDSLTSFLNDVPDSNYIMMYSWRENYWPYFFNGGSSSAATIKTLMQNMGSDVDSLSNYNNKYPWIFFTQKGDPSKTIEVFASGINDVIELKGKMENNWLDGAMTSTMIGPALSWESLHWQVLDGESGNAEDSSHVKLYGIANDGSRLLLVDTSVVEGDIFTLSTIDASVYPNLELQVYLSDDSLRTPKMLGRWQVLYEEIPEAALNPLRLSSVVLADTVEQGEEFIFTTAIENISTTDMSPVQVVSWVIDANFNLQKATYKQLPALAAGEIIYDTVRVNTVNLLGNTGLWYEVNPYDGEVSWQIEKYHFNNINLAQFEIKRDNINPILDVTFDGIHILDGDIVSPKPYIVITLDDENQHLPLDDPSLIQVFIEYPNSEAPVLLDPSVYTFVPGEAPNNKARIELQGSFPEDGEYKLKVMSQDRSSNISGTGDGLFDYTISFEVINKSSITQVLNWPNPFSTSTQFVFTLTGSEIPEQFMIQILTISGKIVREISKEEYGAINIGRNISDFKWDGTDRYGDRLANGIYLYRVMLNTDDHVFEERSIIVSGDSGPSSVKDKYFTKGFGKMYLIR